jgi:hypothetical protein
MAGHPGSGRFLLAAARVYLVEGVARPGGPVSITYAEKGGPKVMSVPATMRALQQSSLNGPQDMRLITDAPVPSPGPGEAGSPPAICPTARKRSRTWKAGPPSANSPCSPEKSLIPSR